MKNNVTYVTKEGLQEYKDALKYAESELAAVKATRNLYGKNSVEDYQTTAYDMDLKMKENIVKDLKDAIARLVVIDQSNEEKSKIGFGDVVTVIYMDTNEAVKVQLTGGMVPLILDDNREIDIITVNSPLGKAIYQSSVGDVSSFKVGKRQITIKIVSKEESNEKQESSMDQKEKGEE